MAKIPAPMNTTAESIVRWYESRTEQPRPHLGCSEIGRACDRQLWYSFRWALAKKFPGRILRLFNTGVREETRFIEELKAIGAEVYDRDPETGAQHRFSAVRGHFAGSCDGIGRGLPEAPKTWAVIEFKTHGEKSFKDLQANGVASSKAEHYIQMQMYMGFAELDRALYLACNKNTDEIYSEWVHFEKSVFDMYLERAGKIIDAATPPEKVNTDPAWYLCKMCDYHAICHGEQIPQKNCRTCVHASPVENASWRCEKDSRYISFDEQQLGCRQHLFIPPLVSWADVVDAGDDWVVYRDPKTDLYFANVTEDCDRTDLPDMCLTSAELPATIRSIVNDELTADLKKEFPTSRIVSSSLTNNNPPF